MAFNCPHCGRQVPVTNGIIGRHRIVGKGPGSSVICERSGTETNVPRPKKGRRSLPYSPKKAPHNRKHQGKTNGEES